MSTTETIINTRRGGTPFEQFLQAQSKPRPVPPRAPTPAPPKPHPSPRCRPETPSRSYQQRVQSLLLANDIRSRRADLKREIKAAGQDGARRRVIWILLERPADLATMKVYDLLLAQPGWGAVKTTKTLRISDISVSKTLAGMTGRQRRDLLNLLGWKDR